MSSESQADIKVTNPDTPEEEKKEEDPLSKLQTGSKRQREIEDQNVTIRKKSRSYTKKPRKMAENDMDFQDGASTSTPQTQAMGHNFSLSKPRFNFTDPPSADTSAGAASTSSGASTVVVDGDDDDDGEVTAEEQAVLDDYKPTRGELWMIASQKKAVKKQVKGVVNSALAAHENRIKNDVYDQTKEQLDDHRININSDVNRIVNTATDEFKSRIERLENAIFANKVSVSDFNKKVMAEMAVQKQKVLAAENVKVSIDSIVGGFMADAAEVQRQLKVMDIQPCDDQTKNDTKARILYYKKEVMKKINGYDQSFEESQDPRFAVGSIDAVRVTGGANWSGDKPPPVIVIFHKELAYLTDKIMLMVKKKESEAGVPKRDWPFKRVDPDYARQHQIMLRKEQDSLNETAVPGVRGVFWLMLEVEQGLYQLKAEKMEPPMWFAKKKQEEAKKLKEAAEQLKEKKRMEEELEAANRAQQQQQPQAPK